MSSEPTFPSDVQVGPADQADKADLHPDPTPRQQGSNRTRQIVTGAALGIGSAALVAALLYANRSRKGGKN